ncbi:MAG: peptidoglycan DD-metalloendopeptidase family protein [Desulfamplus sp.]|nr:peptidoglycan DD-metalloendopeptidase family protein [Desulfamplus sp.]
MNPSYNLSKSNSNNPNPYEITNISERIFKLVSVLILFLSFFITFIAATPERVYAAKKKSVKITKSAVKSKTNKHITSVSQSTKNSDSKLNKVVSKQKKNNIDTATKINTSNVKIRQVSGIVKGSIHKTTTKMGLNKKLVNQLGSIFKNTPAISNLQQGDLIQVAYQEKYENGKRVKTGVITAAIITSKKRSYHAYRFTYNGKNGYYDEKGNSLSAAFLKAPLKYREISSGFSTRRFHPIKQIYQPHPGIDYAAPKGTPVQSVGDGIVVFKGYADSAGNYLKIKHPGVGVSEYMHLSKFHSSIKVNKRVSKGDIIGYVGATGYATGPHLDLRFMVNNRYVDYRKFKLPQGEQLPKKFRNLFFQHVAMVNKQWDKTRRELSWNTVVNPLERPTVASNTKRGS